MKAIIVSDLHIGSRYCLRENLIQFFKHIPHDYEFILNGDIVDAPYAKMTSADQQLVKHLAEMSYRQKVVWIRGNHDNGYVPEHVGKIKIKAHYALQKRVFIAHGDFFDEVMPQSQMFIKVFKILHDFRIKLGARPIHVAQYAKKWNRFYAYLRKNVMLNAVHYAVENGFKAVVCGHTHFAEQQFVNGIRYVNTGAWTEQPTYYAKVTADDISLNKTSDSAALVTLPGTKIRSVSLDQHQNPTQPVSHHN